MHAAAPCGAPTAFDMLGADVFHAGELDAALRPAEHRFAMRPTGRFKVKNLELDVAGRFLRGEQLSGRVVRAPERGRLAEDEHRLQELEEHLVYGGEIVLGGLRRHGAVELAVAAADHAIDRLGEIDEEL